MLTNFGENWMNSNYFNKKIKIRVSPNDREYLKYILPIFIKIFSIDNGRIFSAISTLNSVK